MKIVLKNLTKKFPNRSKNGPKEVTAVGDFTFEIPDGKLVGLLGPSGCGKSTALNLISGLLKPTSGQIFFGEDDITGLPAEKRGVGIVFQNVIAMLAEERAVVLGSQSCAKLLFASVIAGKKTANRRFQIHGHTDHGIAMSFQTVFEEQRCIQYGGNPVGFRFLNTLRDGAHNEGRYRFIEFFQSLRIGKDQRTEFFAVNGASEDIFFTKSIPHQTSIANILIKRMYESIAINNAKPLFFQNRGNRTFSGARHTRKSDQHSLSSVSVHFKYK